MKNNKITLGTATQMVNLHMMILAISSTFIIMSIECVINSGMGFKLFPGRTDIQTVSW